MGSLSCDCYRRGREPLTERHVQAVWYDRDMRPKGLVTSCGEPVRVVHPGEWNLGAGPDFRNAVLEVGEDRRRIAGDVEVHVSPHEWNAHGHGSDPAYRNVVAHVTWGCGPVPETLPQGAVSIWIGRFLTADVGFSPDQIDVGAYPFARLPMDARPCFDLLGHDPGLADEVLRAAGRYRLQTKARRLSRMLNAPAGRSCGRRQLFYREMMGALGYRRNARAFRELADAVPLSAVLAEPDNAEAALLSAAQFVELRRGGFRPANDPERRLKAAARLFSETRAMALLDARDFSDASCRGMLRALAADGLMGRGRAAAIVANVVVPFALAESRLCDVPAWLPAEDVSEPVRLTAFRLFGRDSNPATAYAGDGVKIQGLIQIHRDFCLQVHPDCLDCGLVGGLASASGF